MLSQTSINKSNEVLQLETITDFQHSKHWEKLPPKIKRLVEYLSHINQNSNETGYIAQQTDTPQQQKLIESQYHAFCNMFKRLSQQEQHKFLQQVIGNMLIKSQGRPRVNLLQNEQQHNCKIRVVTLYVQHWADVKLRLNWTRKKITVLIRERVIDIYLREYMMRRSKVHPHCMVLENVGFASKDYQYNYHFKFDDSAEFSRLEDDIRLIIADCLSDELLWEINENKAQQASNKNRLRLFLTTSTIHRLEDFLKKAGIEGRQSIFFLQSDRGSDQASLKQQMELERYRQIFTSDRVKINCCESDESIYHAKFIIDEGPASFLKNFLQAYRTRHKMLIKVKELERVEVDGKAAVHSAVYQKLIWDEKIYGQMLIGRQEIIDMPLSSAPTLLYSFMGIDHKDNHNFIQYIQITVRSEEGQLQVTVFAKFYRNEFDQQIIQAYLSNFTDVFAIQSHLHASQCFNNIHGEMREALASKSIPTQQIKVFKKHEATNQEIENLFSDGLGGNKKEFVHTKITNDYLQKHYILQPSRIKTGKIIKEHFLWNSWKRAEGGGLVCINEELVDRQKKMFKLVIKKFGQTLLMGKNIINFSLPVVVFKKESHLQSLAKSYLYAPIFTQKAAKVSDPLQRMKFSIVLMITENALSINMEKPFNPLLGETFQGWIDGCPIYLEQVSHHPPISAYYLVGRGYKKYGCIQPKISIGLNSGSGYSIFPHFVEFDDGGKIEYICAKICIGGLLIGQRTFNFQDRIYAYDRQNRYFASVGFGPVRKGFFSSSDQPEDYFHGYIYRVTAEFEQIFDKEKGMKPHPQPQHIVEKLSFFDGIWSSSVNVDGKEILNLKTDLPYQFVYEPTPLPSNSSYRQDLSYLLAGDLEAAQIAKEEMEEFQRRDRRLREEHMK